MRVAAPAYGRASRIRAPTRDSWAELGVSLSPDDMGQGERRNETYLEESDRALN